MTNVERQNIPVSQLYEDLSSVLDRDLRYGNDFMTVGGDYRERTISTLFETAAGVAISVCDEHTPLSSDYTATTVYRSDFARRWHAIKERGAFFGIQEALVGDTPDTMYLLFPPSKLDYSIHPYANPYRNWREIAELTGDISDIEQPVALHCPIEKTITGKQRAVSGQLELMAAQTIHELTPGSLLHELALVVQQTKADAFS